MQKPVIPPELSKGAEAAVREAGAAILARFSPDGRPKDRRDIGAMIAANDAISMAILIPRLEALVPGSRVIEDELATGGFGAGDFWVVDPVEGAINQIHGLPDWCITATLIRDDAIVLTTVFLPLQNDLYTATAGGGAWLNGHPIRVSNKPDLNGAMMGTGQAAPGEGADIHARIGASVTTMLGNVLTVRVSVPATLQLVQVAAGRMDGFWQFSGVLSGLVSGALLVSEAGGRVTDCAGNDWTLHARDFVATPPQFTNGVCAALSPISNSYEGGSDD